MITSHNWVTDNRSERKLCGYHKHVLGMIQVPTILSLTRSCGGDALRKVGGTEPYSEPLPLGAILVKVE